MLLNFLKISFYFFVIIFFLSCAIQVPPSGGQIDLIPPTIISTYPQTNSTNFSDNKIIVAFSEYVDKQSVENSFSIFPQIQNIEFEWNETEITIFLQEELLPNTTYIVNFGTEIFDIRNKNKLENSFSFAFSTGNKINDGAILGKVFGDKISDIKIIAYSNSVLNFDTLSIENHFPQYITYINKDGTYKLNFLSNGKYRIFALKDKNGNSIFDSENEELGITYQDVLLDNERNSFENLNFKLKKFDTKKFYLTSVNQLSLNMAELSFSKEIDVKNLKTENVKISDSVQNIEIEKITYHPLDSKKIIVITKSNFKITQYNIDIIDLYDVDKNQIEKKLNLKNFYLTEKKTEKLQLKFCSIKDSMKNVETLPIFFCMWNENINQNQITFNIQNINGEKQNLTIEHNSYFQKIVPVKKMEPSNWYSFSIVQNDSIIKLFHFKTDNKQFGKLSGNVSSKNTNIFVETINLETKKKFSTKSDTKNNFEFNELPSGKYVLTTFEDIDNNQQFSFGKILPFSFSEKFYEFPDTIKIKSNWNIENIQIQNPF